MTAEDNGSSRTTQHVSAGDPTGRLFIVSAPSGAGKSTLCLAVRRHMPDLAYSVSYTTRKPRQEEQDGREYHFVAKAEFEQGIAHGHWAEWARVHGNYYGSSAQWIRQALASGQDILMDIDVQGAQQIVKRFPHAVTIFVMAPSLQVLEQRLTTRDTDDPATIALRLANAKKEMAQKDRYAHIVVNDDLKTATRAMIDLISRYRDH